MYYYIFMFIIKSCFYATIVLVIEYEIHRENQIHV